jgi:hypothetical protein
VSYRPATGSRLMKSIILDGEMLVWDPSLEKYLAFGTLKTAALGKTGPRTLLTIRSSRRRYGSKTMLYVSSQYIGPKRLIFSQNIRYPVSE